MIINFDIENMPRFVNPVVLHVHFYLENSSQGQQNNLYKCKPCKPSYSSRKAQSKCKNFKARSHRKGFCGTFLMP